MLFRSREWLRGFCAERELPIVADEVFADYPLETKADAVSAMGDSPVVTCSLGGLSKSAGLPQVKLGWMAVDGPPAEIADTLRRLEMIADTYLSVSTPAQHAAVSLIDRGREIRAAIAERLRENLHGLRSALEPYPALSLLAPEGGWSAVLRVPATVAEDALVLRLFNEAGVLVHPGYFFDFATEAFLIVSLLPEPANFMRGIERMAAAAAGPAA